ncbi:uncharacterized protein BJ171DRAFT_629302 [Polychytrium aggregatum]|uniref:uncharacterized protein n=1 Tax=Polychytrium aggregatum TaxID=110093 RepID=UPI0022FE0806|nr:uncharacterized protein BJ171DRAFT_629302 [Polychytrium aggregatum]KAI9201964.1 hypothetical protein BJ171DRAFT_629302 [Polychytrium aggregatum]
MSLDPPLMTNLPSTTLPASGTSNCYATITYQTDPVGRQIEVHRTQVVRRSLNPKWPSEKFALRLGSSEHSRTIIRVAVYAVLIVHSDALLDEGFWEWEQDLDALGLDSVFDLWVPLESGGQVRIKGKIRGGDRSLPNSFVGSDVDMDRSNSVPVISANDAPEAGGSGTNRSRALSSSVTSLLTQVRTWIPAGQVPNSEGVHRRAEGQPSASSALTSFPSLAATASLDLNWLNQWIPNAKTKEASTSAGDLLVPPNANPAPSGSPPYLSGAATPIYDGPQPVAAARHPDAADTSDGPSSMERNAKDASDPRIVQRKLSQLLEARADQPADHAK